MNTFVSKSPQLVAIDVRRDEEAGVLLRNQIQQRREPRQIAAVLDRGVAVHVVLEELSGAALHARIGAVLARVHLFRGRFVEDADVAVLTVLQVRDHESRDVVAGRQQAAGRNRRCCTGTARV